MQIKLTVGDRIILPAVLPAKGGFEDMVVKGDILDKLRLTQEEMEKFGVAQIRDQIRWTDTETEFEFEFTTLEENAIIKALKEASDKKELTQDHVGLYKKFVAKTTEEKSKKK